MIYRVLFLLSIFSLNVFAHDFVPSQSLLLKNHQPKPNIFVMYDNSNSIASNNMMVGEHFLGYGSPICDRPNNWNQIVSQYSTSKGQYYDPFSTGKYIPYNPDTHKGYDFALYVKECKQVNKVLVLNSMLKSMIPFYKDKAYVGLGSAGSNNTATLTWAFNRDKPYGLIENPIEDLSKVSSSKWDEIFISIDRNVSIYKFRQGWSPLFPALYNLSLYFRNYPIVDSSQGSLYGYSYKQYDSPLKYRCSANHIFMLTDTKANRSYIDVFAKQDVDKNLLPINVLGTSVGIATTNSPFGNPPISYSSLYATNLSDVFMNNMFDHLAYIEDAYTGSEEGIDYPVGSKEYYNLDLNRYEKAKYRIPFANYQSALYQNLISGSEMYSPSYDSTGKSWGSKNSVDQKLTISALVLSSSANNKKVSQIIDGTGGIVTNIPESLDKTVLYQILRDFAEKNHIGVMYSNAQSIESQGSRTDKTMRYVFDHDIYSNVGVVSGYSWDNIRNKWNEKPSWTTESANERGEVIIMTMDYSSGKAPVSSMLSKESLNSIFKAMNPDSELTQAHINWLKGIEASSDDKLKPRPTILGPIVNGMATLYSLDKEYINLNTLSDALRNEFIEKISMNVSKAAQSNDLRTYRNRLIVNSNDGMIHFINAQTKVNGNSFDGGRYIAYFPGFLAGRLLEITNIDEPFKFTMDGETNIFRFKGSDGAIKTVSLAGMGAGGKAIVGYQILDNSDILPLYEIVNENDFPFNSTGFEELGYTYSNFEFLNQANTFGGQGVGIFGNGYGEKRSILYLIDIETGKLINKIVLSENGGGASSPAAKVVNDPTTGFQKLEYVVVGDLSGNLYKVQFINGDLANFSVDKIYEPGTLFETPITTRPMLYRMKGTGDIWAYFGTGKKSDERYDRGKFSKIDQYFIALKVPETNRTIKLNDLVKKEFEVDTSTGLISINESIKPANGWYLEFRDGERVVFSPVLYQSTNDVNIVFSTWGIIEGQDNDMCIGDIGYGKQFSLQPGTGNTGVFKVGKNITAGVVIEDKAPGVPSGTGVTTTGDLSGGVDSGINTINKEETKKITNDNIISTSPTDKIHTKCLTSTVGDVVGDMPDFCPDSGEFKPIIPRRTSLIRIL